MLLVVCMVLSEGKLVIRLMDQDKLYELVKKSFPPMASAIYHTGGA